MIQKANHVHFKCPHCERALEAQVKDLDAKAVCPMCGDHLAPKIRDTYPPQRVGLNQIAEWSERFTEDDYHLVYLEDSPDNYDCRFIESWVSEILNQTGRLKS